ncbi:GTPase HflX [Candidatus Dependentiae bacterium]|nr:GTPase HflX [Candidatus Dependentiae bacterium]
MAKGEMIGTQYHIKTLLIGVHAPNNKIGNIESYYQEFLNLARTYGVQDYDFHAVKIREIDSRNFFTKGKLEEIKEIFDKSNAREVIISDQLTPQQERNLQDLFDCPVLDRTRLILAIFEKSAVTAEGKTQVEIAKLNFEKTRLAGHGIHLEQQAGAIGLKGPGETLKEKMTRLIKRNVHILKQKLEKLERVRDAQRKQRLVQQVPQICLVGYTNSGKSSILNILTHSDVVAKDQLFATLDSTTRQLFVEHKKVGVISDTVGFIQNLPTQLIDAFKSTLAEAKNADLLLLVTDISDQNWKAHINTVLETLHELHIEKDTVFIFNKSDNINPEDLQRKIAEFGFFGPYIVTNTLSKEGIAPLKQYLATWKPKKRE